MLTVSEDGTDLVAALRAGACGYLLKNIDADILIDSIRRAARGESVVSTELTGKLVAGVRDGAGVGQANVFGSLSPRERDVVGHIAAGSSNKEIASDLIISENTVRAHVRTLMQKLHLDNRTQLAVYSVYEGYGLDSRKNGAFSRTSQPEEAAGR